MKINSFNLLFVMTISVLAGAYLPLVGVIPFAFTFGIIGVFLWPILEEDDR
jgi:hypothetical protein